MPADRVASAEVAIIVVNWNGGALLRACLESLVTHPPSVAYEVVVVDNASTDGSLAWLRSLRDHDVRFRDRLRIIESGENRGFAVANNLAFSSTDAPLLMLLNADAQVHPHTIDALVATACANSRIGACGPRVLSPDGSLQPNVAPNPTTPWDLIAGGLRIYAAIPRGLRRRLSLRHWDHGTRRSVPFISATALLVKRSVITEVGGFDERFFMYGEDAEWCLRMKRAGWEIVLEPAAEVTHVMHAFSSQRWEPVARQEVSLEALFLYWDIALSRRHAIANSVASSFLLLLALPLRVIRRRPTDDVRSLLAMQRKFLTGTWQRPGERTIAASKPVCPLCEAALGRPAFPFESAWQKVIYTRRRCRGCGAVVVDPIPDPGTLSEIYDWGGYHEPEYLAAGSDGGRRHARAIRLLRHRLSRADSVLDFGCGSGEFLRLVHDLGKRCEGVEYTESAIRMSAERSGVRVSSLGALKERGVSFDVIHLCDVLPHLPDPRATMRELETLLASGGRFLIDGPLEQNASVVLWTSEAVKALRRRLGRDRPAARPPTMLFRFDRRAQRAFFRDRLGYREEYFSVHETGWPLLAPRSRSPRLLLGWLAVLVSWLDPSRPRRIGNRFLAVLAPHGR